MEVKYKRVSEHAFTPTKATTGSAAYDLYSAHNYIIKPIPELNEGVSTDIVLEIPNGYYGKIYPRSGLALKKYINIGGGIIDSDYRGTITITIFNHGDENFYIKKGDRIAQIIISKLTDIEFKEVDVLDDTKRGASGFGSTG